MPNPPPAPLTFYPAYCFPLSPTHNTWARLTAAHVHTLRERTGFEGQNLLFHLNHPIKWIRLVGVIVALDLYSTRWTALLDDGSGATIEITCGRPATVLTTRDTLAEGSTDLSNPDAPSARGVSATGRDVDLSGVDIGTVVKVKGGVGSFRDVRQMRLERISIIRTTNEEVTTWAENTAFRKGVLDKAWVISEEEEKRARRKAEGLDREKWERGERRRRKRREEEEKGKCKGVDKGKEERRGERKRRGEGSGRREGENEDGPSRRGVDGGYKERRRDGGKARR